MTPPEAEVGPGYHYNCPNCNNVTLERNISRCDHCGTVLVWSGDPTDQPRQHPAQAAEELGQATLYALAGDPIVENEHGVPDVHHGVIANEQPADRALPPGQPTAADRLDAELDARLPPPSTQSPASEASGVQEVEAPASALDKPDSLPGGSKLRPPEEEKQEVVEATPGSVLPTPPEGKEKPVPELLKAVDLTDAKPALPDDPDPVAPLSRLRAHEIAAVAHAANLAYREIMGDEPGPGWLDMDVAEQESVIAGVRAVLAGSVNGPAYSHKAWYDRKLSEGWVYGPEKDVEAKIHPNMLAKGVWGDLPDHERRKDLLFLAVVVSLIRHV